MNDFDEYGYKQRLKGDWMQTHTLKQVYFRDFRPEDVSIEDIAHHTSKIDRFTGAGDFLYSVALHALIGSFQVPEEYKLTFLMHDSAEAYIGDISRPLKNSVKDDMIRKIENPILQTIFTVYSIPWPIPQIIKEYDLALCFAEAEVLGLDTSVWGNYSNPEIEIDTRLMYEMDWRVVKNMFLDRFKELTG